MERTSNGQPPVVPDLLADARAVLRRAHLAYRGEIVGTVAARDPTFEIANYGECFVRDFAVTAAVWLTHDPSDGDQAPGTTNRAAVANFIRTVAEVQAKAAAGSEGLRPPPGLMPASFSVDARGGPDGEPDPDAELVADFGQRAIGRVVPVDSALWWLWILGAYQRVTGDRGLGRSPAVRAAIERVMTLYLQPQFEMLPSLLVPDGSAMIDRRMGVHGHPLDVQVLFWAALRATRKVLEPTHPLQPKIRERLAALGHHLRTDYWVDRTRIEQVRRFPVEEYGPTPRNPWNLHPDAIPSWTMAWLGEGGGYFAGNLGPSRLDVHFFALGNLLAVSTGLATEEQAQALFDLLERHERDLLGVGGVKLMYPPLEGRDWETLTGSDHKNVPWSYHNAGTWPMLLWPLAAAARVAGRTELAVRTLQRTAARLAADGWPEYYDGPYGGLVGRQARLQQTWSAAGALAAAMLVADEGAHDPFAFERDDELEEAIAKERAIPARTGSLET
jgi:glycogen debranching enzyme